MTAIAGVVGPDSTEDRQRLTRAILDEQSCYGSTNNSFASADRSTFGISPFGMQQSVIAAIDRDWLLVADLRLDNRNELRARLGAAAAAKSDADLLLHAWIEAGEASLSWIAGDFALAIYDARERTLILARDIAGELPLFFSKQPDRVAFASMPTGLRPFVGGLALDKRRLALTAFDSGQGDEHSHFESIERVLPGEVVRIDGHGIQRGTYWHPRSMSDLRPGDQSSWIEAYRHALDTAVGARLAGSAGPIATHLSSGLDSSAVTATAARLLGSPATLIAFTSAPASEVPVPARMHRIGDESAVAAETAAMHGLRHVVVRDTPPLGELMRRNALFCQQPITSASNIAWLAQIRAEAAALGSRRLLSGGMGNISLNYGGLYVLANWIRGGQLATWYRQARMAAARPDTRWHGVLYNSFAPWIPPGVNQLLQRIFLQLPQMDQVTFLRPEWVAAGLAAEPEHHYGLDHHGDRIRIMRENDNGALRKGWLAEDGIEERDPLADRKLIEFSLTIPPEQLYWNGESRPLARAALADRLPRTVLEMKVRGLQGSDWAQRFTRAEAGELIEEISASSTAQELLDLTAMRRALDRWPTEGWNRFAILREFRFALISALATGMFALVHEQRSAAAKINPPSRRRKVSRPD